MSRKEDLISLFFWLNGTKWQSGYNFHVNESTSFSKNFAFLLSKLLNERESLIFKFFKKSSAIFNLWAPQYF